MRRDNRRLSPWRVMLGLLILVGMSFGAFWAIQFWQTNKALASHQPWFAAYVDVTATPAYSFEQLGATPMHNVVLSFIVASKTDGCVPMWGGVYTLEAANEGVDLDRRIARLRQQGGNIVVSFGGQRNDELAITCTDVDELVKAYQLVIDRYDIDTIDLDIEGEGLKNTQALKRRATAIATLQKTYRAEKKNLAVWLTLPVSPQGMTVDGTNAVKTMLTAGVDLAGVNVMTMDYGQSREESDSMQRASEKALTETHRQLGILYKQVGINLTNPTIWSKIGATPMIGQNDVIGEVFTLEDAEGLNKFAHDKGMGRMSMWSANRDIQCGENYVDTKIVSDSCSGVKQDKLSFSVTLSKDFTGDLKQNAAVVTTNEPHANTQLPDDPKKSPYQIWKESGAYLAGTKVVWHRNVYQAKWWTQGDMPDNPVLQAWETPWQLIGPVLPGEKPILQPTLPKGMYPEWSGTQEYETGQRVLFEGIPYQAKWWTQGDSPAAASANFDSSPWAPLTQEQINDLLSR